MPRERAGRAPRCLRRPAALRAIYVAGADGFQREHELGHLFDAERLSDPQRAQVQRLLGFPRSLPWDNGTGLEGFQSPMERFADAYAACRLGLDPRRRWETAYDYMPSRTAYGRVCAFLRAVSRTH